jgi:enoyl-CoA hydratase/carnithine racemase
MTADCSNDSIPGPNGRPFRSLRISRAGMVDTVTLDRPEALNGLTAEMIDELLRYFRRCCLRSRSVWLC